MNRGDDACCVETPACLYWFQCPASSLVEARGCAVHRLVGPDKGIFGTNFPLIDPEIARREIETLPIRAESKREFLRDNATKLYKLSVPSTPDA